MTGAAQQRRCREAADTGADDGYRERFHKIVNINKYL
jgi:hypothetical protein